MVFPVLLFVKRYGLYIILSKQLHMIFLNNCSVNFRIKFLCNHCTILSLVERKLVSSPTLYFFLSLAIFYKVQYKSSIPLLYAIAVNILYSVQNPIEKYVYAVLLHVLFVCRHVSWGSHCRLLNYQGW